MLLGGNKPVQSHRSSQPFSSLYLHTQVKKAKVQFAQIFNDFMHLLKSVVIRDSHLLDVIFRELFENLTEDLVFERLGLQSSFKDLISEFDDRANALGRVIAHILHHRCSRCRVKGRNT